MESKKLTLYPLRVPIGTLEFLQQDPKSANWNSFGCYVESFLSIESFLTVSFSWLRILDQSERG